MNYKNYNKLKTYFDDVKKIYQLPSIDKFSNESFKKILGNLYNTTTEAYLITFKTNLQFEDNDKKKFYLYDKEYQFIIIFSEEFHKNKIPLLIDIKREFDRKNRDWGHFYNSQILCLTNYYSTEFESWINSNKDNDNYLWLFFEKYLNSYLCCYEYFNKTGKSLNGEQQHFRIGHDKIL